MDTLIFYSITVLSFFTFVFSIRNFIRDPFEFGNTFFIIYFIFYYLPVIDYWFNFGWFGEEYLWINGYQYNPYIVSKFALISYVIMISFMIGYRLSISKNKHRLANYNTEKLCKLNHHRLKIVKTLLIIVLVVVLYNAFLIYGYGIDTFFSMARKNTLTGTWQRMLIAFLPAPIFGLEYIQEIQESGKIKSKLIIYAIALLFIIMVLGQRRELINLFIFMVLLFMDAKVNKFYKFNTKEIRKKTRKYMIFLGIIIVFLIPITWYMRSYSTQLQFGKIVNPFEKRGWLELLFGSGSSGLQTSIILDGYSEQYGLPTLPSIKLMLTYFIPRSVYSDKSEVLTSYVKNTLNTSGNLSVFYINDVWFNFYLFSPFISILIGFLIKILVKPIKRSEDIFNKISGYMAFALIISLFKNGYVQYFFSYLIFIIIWTIAKRFSIVKLRRR